MFTGTQNQTSFTPLWLRMFQTYNCPLLPSVSHRNGLTLVELMVTLVLISILVGAVWMVCNSGISVFYSQFTRTGVKGEADKAFTTLNNELRQTVSITAATATSLSFTLDSDGDGVNESIQYSWSGTAGAPLNRISTSPSSFTIPVVNSVSNLALSYYDASNSLLSFPVTASQVRLVAIDLTISSKDETFELRSKIKLRDL